MKKSWAMMVGAVLAGCQHLPSVGPDYEGIDLGEKSYALPDAGMPTTNLNSTCEYRPAEGKDDVREAITASTLDCWWKRFNDPVLDGLVESAVSNNASFRMAVKRLEASNWELLGTYSAFLPKFNVNGAYTLTRARRNTTYGDMHRHVADLGVGMDWEIDIFGGSRRSTEAALAMADAAGWTVRDAWVSLTTQIGVNYINLRMAQECLDVARTNLVLQSETYEILKSRLDSGIGDELAVNQCMYIVEQTRAKIPTLLAQEESIKNRLAILAGVMPGALSQELAPVSGRDWLIVPQKIAELPLDLMRKRSDVMVAERKLAAQSAKIGVAKARWYPRLFVTGSVGYQSTRNHHIFEADSFLGSFGPSVSWPIFQAGAVYTSVKAEEARLVEAALGYELALENAYAEVRDEYSSYTQEYHRYQSLVAAVKAASDAVVISQDLYKNGLKDFNNVLDAQRSRLSLEEQKVASRALITINLIKLYKALGGGVGE